MLHPSYSDLLEVLNSDPNNDNTIGSRYTIVIAAAKRARQLVDHAEPLTNKVKIDKPVSIAVHELHEGKIRIKKHEDISMQDSSDSFTITDGFHSQESEYEKSDLDNKFYE